MQLTIDTEDIVDIKMSALHEAQDISITTLITEIKKEAPSNIDEDLKVKDCKMLEDNIEVAKETVQDKQSVTQINGCQDDVTNGSNDSEISTNNDKENNAPDNSHSIVKETNDTTCDSGAGAEKDDNENNSVLKDQDDVLSSQSVAKENGSNLGIEDIATESKVETDIPIKQSLLEKTINTDLSAIGTADTTTKSELLNPKNAETNPSVCSEIVNHMDICDSVQLIADKEKESCEVSQMEIDTVEETNILNEDQSATSEVKNDQLETKLHKQIDLEIEPSSNPTNDFSAMEDDRIEDSSITKERIDSFKTSENKINPTSELKDLPTEDIVCDQDTENKETTNNVEESLKNLTEKSDQKKENISSVETKSPSANFIDDVVLEVEIDKNNVKSEFHNFTEDSAKDNKTERDCISVSSLEVDDVEIVPAKKENKVAKEQDRLKDVAVNNEKNEDSFIEILDHRDSVISTNKQNEGNAVCDVDSKEKISMEAKIKENEEDKKEIKSAATIVKEQFVPSVCKLSNNLDILSDEEDENSTEICKNNGKQPEKQKQPNTLNLLSDEEDEPPTKVSKISVKQMALEEKQPIAEKQLKESDRDKQQSTALNILSDDEEELPSKPSQIDEKQVDPKLMPPKDNNNASLDILSDEEVEVPSKVSKDDEKQVEEKPRKLEEKQQKEKELTTLNILSDEEDESAAKDIKVDETQPTVEETQASVEEKQPQAAEKQCINIDDDDDIMFVDDVKETSVEKTKPNNEEVEKVIEQVNDETGENETDKAVEEGYPKTDEKESMEIETPKVSEKEEESKEAVKLPNKPLLPMNFLKSAKKNLADMTRDELEDFCILKIVESIVDRSSLSDLKSRLKTIEQNMEEYKKKALVVAKQNRDLQVVLKSVQEEQKNRPNAGITPLKITRSVGMQVLMVDKPRKKTTQNLAQKAPNRNGSQPQKNQKTNQNIPVPRLIPASPAKSTPNSPVASVAKPPTPNTVKNSVSPAQKTSEKRPMTRQASSSSMTVDLTDDEPPAKVAKTSPVPPVRLVPSQNLMAPRAAAQNNPRKVFIPINGQGPVPRGSPIYVKNIPGTRQRLPIMPRMQSNQVRANKVAVNRHPAPLPDVMKQYQPPTWKALPPAPDLKLSKVENGIVISWKIEGYQEDSYEKIASYQLYAYQETSLPPSTGLWKKIGDVKALPLPMACTLTQFMAGYKYYFAVRAVDVKSRLGPFSLPGSILLLNKT